MDYFFYTPCKCVLFTPCKNNNGTNAVNAFGLGDFARYYLCGIITEAESLEEEIEEEQAEEGML